jgi:hypothetical protein
MRVYQLIVFYQIKGTNRIFQDSVIRSDDPIEIWAVAEDRVLKLMTDGYSSWIE